MRDLEALKATILGQISEAKSLQELEILRVKYLGRKGEIIKILAQLKGLPTTEKIKQGKELNIAKREIEALLTEKETELKSKLGAGSDWLDVTAPGKKVMLGHLHPVTLVRRQIEGIFQSMGFSIIDGPEVESEYYNFDALNIPANHPAREMWDTFWLRGNQKTKNEKLKTKNETRFLLRTHTSPVQVRYMESHQPPLRIIAPGRCYRYEATDARHDWQFHQVEGLMVVKAGDEHSISIANFKGVLQEFFSRLFAKEIEVRLRPSYFPFVEPGFEVDITCPKHTGEKCGLCGGSGFLEIMGAGMVHPNVFKSAGHNPEEWRGFAFGLGMERVAMIKYGINDIRWFHSGDLRFLNQF